MIFCVTFPESALGHPGWRARDRLRQRRAEGEALGTTAEGQAASGPSRADNEGAKLPEGKENV